MDYRDNPQRRLLHHIKWTGFTPPCGLDSIKSWMGSTHFQMKTLKRVGTEMALHVLAYNLKRVINIMGIVPLMAAIRA